MRNRFIIGAGILVAAFTVLLALTGCEGITVTFDEGQPYGKVLNVKSGAGVEAMVVTLTPLDYNVPSEETKKEQAEEKQEALNTDYQENPDEYKAVTNTSGEFDWANEEKSIPLGDYMLSASTDDYVVFEREISVNALFPDIGTLGVMPADAEGTSIVLMWNEDFDDVDAHLTHPIIDSNTYIVDAQAPQFKTPYDTGEEDNLVFPGDISKGFSPETFKNNSDFTYAGEVDENDNKAERQKIYYGHPSSASDSSATWDNTSHTNTLDHGTKDYDANSDGTNDDYYLKLDVDATQGKGPETITVRSIPWYINPNVATTSTTGGGNTGFGTGIDYLWVGVMEYYVYAFDSNWEASNDTSQDYLSEVGEGRAANAMVYLVNGTEILGKYTVPSYTKIKGARILRVNCFYDQNDNTIFQFVPDIRVLQTSGEIRSLSSDGIVENGIVTVETNTGGRR